VPPQPRVRPDDRARGGRRCGRQPRGDRLFRVQPVVDRADELDFEELLLAVAREAASIFPDDRDLAAAFLEGVAQAERSAPLRQKMGDDYEDLRGAIAGLLETALGDRLPDVDRRGVASVFIALDVGFMVQALLDPDRALTPEEMVRSLAAFAVLFDRASGPARP
jgi:hypothetical protein